jgi:hypothetical protein
LFVHVLRAADKSVVETGDGHSGEEGHRHEYTDATESDPGFFHSECIVPVVVAHVEYKLFLDL